MKYTHSFYFAAVYNGNAYGQDCYNTCSATTTQPTTNNSTTSVPANSGKLVNTGSAVLGVATIACVVIFVTLVVLFWKKPKKPIVKL